MTQEEKQLLLKDLCGRLPYHTVLHFDDRVHEEYLYGFRENGGKFLINDAYYIEEVKPYLRPMSSMTEEEIKTYQSLQDTACSYHYEFGDIVDDILYFDNDVSLDYLNSIHIDYRGLIPIGFALEAPKDMYI